MPSMRPSWATTATAVVAGQANHPEILTPALVAVRQSGPVIRRHLLIALLLSLGLLSTLLHLAQLHIDPLGQGNVPYYAAGLIAIALRFGLPRATWRHAVPVAHFSEYVAIFTTVTLIGASASYPVAALTHGYADVTLQAIDEAMGFDWVHWYRIVAEYPVLQALGTIAYRSIYLTPVLLLWSAARSGQHERAYRFIAGFWVASIITLAAFTLMPAVGPFSHLWHEQIHYMPESELWQSGLLPALRAHSVHIVDLGQLRGIVSAPSFHTAAAVLYIVAGWRCPSLRWPVTLMNAAMLLSTPVEGTHYLIDMILGVMVALTALALVRLYERKVIAPHHA